MDNVRNLGLREWVALGILGTGILFGVLFFDPTSTESGSDVPPTISLGATPPTATPAASPTATPVPVTQLEQPTDGWFVVFFERSASGSELRVAEAFLEALDISIDPATSRIEASQQVSLPAARYGFELETDGTLRVSVGDQVLLEEKDDGGTKQRALQFDHPGGQLSLVISVAGEGQPIRLRWVP